MGPLALLVAATVATPPAGAETDPYLDGELASVTAPGADEQLAVGTPTGIETLSGQRNAFAVAEAVQGQSFAGIEYWSRVEVFVVSIDDRIEVIDYSGLSIGSFELPGVMQMSADNSKVVLADDRGQVHRMEWGGGTSFSITTWDVADGPLRAIAARHTSVLFVTEANPNVVSVLDLHTGAIDPGWFEIDEPIELIEYTQPTMQITSATRFYKIAVDIYAPSVEVESRLEIATSDFASDLFGRNTWLGSSLPHATEFVRSQQGPSGRLLEPQATIGSVATDGRHANIGFATSEDALFDIRVHAVEHSGDLVESPAALLALEEGHVVMPRGLAVGRYQAAAVVTDPSCDCLRVVVEYFGPVAEATAEPRRVERGASAQLEITGQGFATVDTVATDLFGEPMPFEVAADGRSITIDVSSYTTGYHELSVRSPIGVAFIEFEIYVPPPEPIPLDFTDTACPWITDSIVRLYSAYFLRYPDEGGFQFWLEGYSSGTWSLARASEFFSRSPEFDLMYGQLSDDEFVDVIYQNILGRNADAGGRAYWIDRMSSEGIGRGTVMLYFSESPEYVTQTATETPFAGYFNWYPEGTTWGCGVGDVSAALPSGPTWVDLTFWNISDQWPTIEIAEEENGRWVARHHRAMAPNNVLFFVAVERPSTVTGIRLSSTAENAWSLVMSPVPTPTVRQGWND